MSFSLSAVSEIEIRYAKNYNDHDKIFIMLINPKQETRGMLSMFKDVFAAFSTYQFNMTPGFQSTAKGNCFKKVFIGDHGQCHQ